MQIYLMEVGKSLMLSTGKNMNMSSSLIRHQENDVCDLRV